MCGNGQEACGVKIGVNVIINIPIKPMMTVKTLMHLSQSPVFFVAGRSAILAGSCGVLTASGTILVAGAILLDFECCCPHFNPDLCRLCTLYL